MDTVDQRSSEEIAALVRRVQRGAATSVQITVHDQVVAELRVVQHDLVPGSVATKILRIMD